MTDDKKKPGQYHKLWMMFSMRANYFSDILMIVSLFSGGTLWLLGHQMATIFLGAFVFFLMLRIFITAVNWRTMRFFPLNTEYRTTVNEMDIDELKKQVKQLMKAKEVHHAA